ncbi:efflux RND transporter periplasmic adaptor subunit [Ferrovibrio sp.]|uniref:efflux RND transporter periplasmic adaptor subunit n=1 Tax=Ferrovibrio sp. TaxID=1917215 RepID=UPI001B487C94|nr:efflux RND transporter periplasmic adaptor subunit [Ferrovibrio sp.]MBP7063560.1 efflux RND transporter periplasmic adaptor subunit [Ferrovibrio sp.]
MKKSILFGLALVLALGAGGYVWKQRQAAPSPAAAPTIAARFEGIEFSPADLSRAERMELRQSVRLSGTVQPLEQSSVRAEVAALVLEVTVRRGETVKKGQLLAKLDTRDLGSRLRERESNLASARSALALAESNRSKAQQLNLRGVKSQTALDDAENAYNTARANVAAIEQQVAMARKALSDAAIYAPIDGQVADRTTNPGERVPVDGKLFVLADLATMELEALVPARDVPKLKIGQRVALKVEGFEGREFAARIDRINPTAQAGSRSILVYIRLANPELTLRGGMFASGEAILAEAREAIAVPREAIRREAGAAHVYVLEKDHVVRRSVELGLTETVQGMVEIRSGVAAGDTIISAPGLKLNDGLAARIAGR